MKTIFISAYRNVSIRYILDSDILGTLKKSSVRIVLFLRDHDTDYHRERIAGENIIFEPIQYDSTYRIYKTSKLNQFFTLVRRCCSGSKNGFENTTDQVYLYLHQREFSGNLKKRFLFLLIKLFASVSKQHRFFRNGLTVLESLFFRGDLYDRIFKKYSPELAVVSSLGYMIDPFFMRAARRNRCKVASIIHSWDNPTTKDYRGAMPDYVIAWNNIMKREVNVFHDIPEDRIYVEGIAHWDVYFNGQFKPSLRDEFCERNGCRKDRKIIFYGSSSFVTFRNTFDVIEQILEAIQSEQLSQPSQLIVRLHPLYFSKKKGEEGQVIERYQKRMQALLTRYNGLICFINPIMKVLNDDVDMPIEDMQNLADILTHADVLLTEYSTLVIEGAIFDVPIINVGLYQYRDTEKPIAYLENLTHIRRILQYGATRNAYTMEQLITYLNAYLADPILDKGNRHALVENEITTNRGVAGKAIAQRLLGWANASKEN